MLWDSNSNYKLFWPVYYFVKPAEIHQSPTTMAFMTLSLEVLEKRIEDYINDGAFMIYWNHQFEDFDYIRESDEEIMRIEMTNLEHNINRGKVVDIKGVQLYPVELELLETECPAYFLVAKRGVTEDMAMSPYFFRSEEKRDEIYHFLCSNQTWSLCCNKNLLPGTEMHEFETYLQKIKTKNLEWYLYK